MRSDLVCAAAAWLLLIPCLRVPAGEVFEQPAEIVEVVSAASDNRDSDASDSPPPIDWNRGPVPHWIWGPEPNTRYVLRKTISPKSLKSARVIASCDNRMTVSVNGQRVLSSDTWEVPVEADLTAQLRPNADNTIVAVVENAGGISGFVCKIALTDMQGETRYIASDGSWQYARRAEATDWEPVRVQAELGAQPWGNVLAQPPGLPAQDQFQVLPGFQVERLFVVPKETLGSWVNITTDHRGRLLVSDQGNRGICRITPPPVGAAGTTRVEQLDLAITSAQGMLYAFDSLYLSVNGGPGSGLYRARDTDGDDQFDEVQKLRDFRGGGEHGPHALRLSPDGQSIYVICGNHTEPPFSSGEDKENPEYHSRIPSHWGEDLLLPRQWDANGHARGRLAPGGWIAATDPDGQTWEIVSIGYRNPFDMDFNADGELFAYDADMEWDMGTPWYRPTRVVHATSGSEFGWRSGTGKWPTWYVDSLPPLINIGPGSPVGVCFGYGARFPARYQKALYLCDWTFGTMYAIHLTPQGASYSAEKEEFLSRSPLPLTDATVAADGALYFTVGGRGTQSELYRVTYVGDDSTEPASARNEEFAELRALRRRLEAAHRPLERPEPAIALALEHVGHADRFLRYAARIALEQQPVDLWRSDVLRLTEPDALITGAVALARQGASSDQQPLLQALGRLDFGQLSERQQLDLLRAYELVWIRLGAPDESQQAELAARFDPYYPSDSRSLNRELCNVLVYLQSPTVVAKTIPLLNKPASERSQDLSALLARNRGYGGAISKMLENQPDTQQLHYAFALRNAKRGWTLESRRDYFAWFNTAHEWSGGNSFQKFLSNIDRDAFENATEQERLAIEATGARQPYVPPELPKPRGPGHDWTLDEVQALAASQLKGRNFKNGERMFAATRCILCHRFGGDGGATGPDLTQLAGRFNIKDLTESILEPSKVISDQYKASTIVTADGKVLTGRIVTENPDSLIVLVDPEDSTKVVELLREQVDDIQPSAVSLMPKDLLKPLNQDEVLDLLAYLLSRGDPRHPMFRK